MRWLRLIISSGGVGIFMMIGNIISALFPGYFRKMVIKRAQGLGIKNPETIVQPHPLKAWIQIVSQEFYPDLITRIAFKGEEAPNTKVYSRDGKTKLGILDLVKEGRPLVLNFGSCT